MSLKESRQLERAYSSPEIGHQRYRTLQALNLRPGDRMLDAGCGPGLLCGEAARLVGERGGVLGVDKNADMLTLAKDRCRDLPWVDFRNAFIERLAEGDGQFNAVACTQVLLYVDDVRGAVEEMHRVLKPGGRIAIVETDWRSCVMNSSDFDLTETMIRAWDDAVASPNLPVRLGPMLRSLGFSAVRVEAVPVVNASLLPDGYSSDIITVFTRKAIEQGRTSRAQAEAWLEDLRRKSRQGEYFFCVNRFLFSAVK